MTWQMLLGLLVSAGIGASIAIVWMLSVRNAAVKQQSEDKLEMRQLQQQMQTASFRAQGWRETAHRHEVQLAYLNGLTAGRNYTEERRLPAEHKLENHMEQMDRGMFNHHPM